MEIWKKKYSWNQEHHVEKGEAGHQEQLYWYLPLNLMTVSLIRLLSRHPVGQILAARFPFSSKWQCEGITNRGENYKVLITKFGLQSKWICGTAQKSETEIRIWNCLSVGQYSGDYRAILTLTAWNSEVSSSVPTHHFSLLFHSSVGKWNIWLTWLLIYAWEEPPEIKISNEQVKTINLRGRFGFCPSRQGKSQNHHKNIISHLPVFFWLKWKHTK